MPAAFIGVESGYLSHRKYLEGPFVIDNKKFIPWLAQLGMHRADFDQISTDLAFSFFRLLDKWAYSRNSDVKCMKIHCLVFSRVVL